MANYNAGSNARKSRAVHERAGTYRKDRHGDVRNPEPPPGRPEPADPLTDGELAEWERVLGELEAMGALYRSDRAALTQYCRLYGETERVALQQGEAQESVRILEQNLGDVQGPDLVQLFGQIVILRKLVSKCTDQLRQGRMALRQYLVEFGLTPASRGRVKLPGAPDAKDAFAAMQRARLGGLKRVK